jgi:hypothetical protein
MPSRRTYFYHCEGMDKSGRHPCPWLCDYAPRKKGDVPPTCIRMTNQKAGYKPKWILDKQEIDYRE